MTWGMQRVNEIVSSNIGDYITNKKTWGNVMYNVLEHGLIGDGTTNDTAALQTLINTAIAAGRKSIFFPHTTTGGQYFVTALTNADQVVFFGDNASFVGGYAGIIHQIGDIQVNKNAPNHLQFRTYDFSDRVVHPDVIKIYTNFGVNGEETPAKYGGFTYWMVGTPYPESNNNYENPSIWASNDGVNWVVPVTVTNPVVPSLTAAGNVTPYTSSASSVLYNSDPDWIIESNKFKMIYRKVDSGVNKIMYTESSDIGVTWTAPVQCYQDTVNHNLSPAIVKIGTNSYVMYYVQVDIATETNYQLMKRTSTDLITWSSPTALTVTTLPNGQRPWHVDAIKTPTGYELLLNTNPAGVFSPNALYILTSTDGTTFSIGNNGDPVVALRDVGWDDTYIYRGSFVKRTDGFYQIWYSAKDTFGDFHVGYMDGFLKEGLRPQGSTNGIPANQRLYFNSEGFTPSWDSVIYSVPGGAMTILGAFNSVSGERKVEALLSDFFAGRDIGTNVTGYDLGRLRLGNYYLWVDTTGKLRIKSSVPTSDLDGTVVGTQT